MKGILLAILLFSVFQVKSQEPDSNYLIVPQKTFDVPFLWKGDSLNGTWEKHAAIMIPVRFANCPLQLYMQFDLGSPSSLFYSGALNELSRLYPLAVQVNDSTKALNDFSFNAGKTKLTAQTIRLKAFNENDDHSASNKMMVIGTLGTDLIDGRIVMIDYPKQKLRINYQLKNTAKTPVTDLIYARRAVLLPAVIRGKQTILYFDTGSSAFELLTSEKTARTLARSGENPSRYPVNSWGRMLTAVSMVTDDSISFSSVSLPLKKVTYMEGVSDTQVGQMMKMGIGGMTGNKLFLASRLFLDLKNKKFAILASGE